MRATNNVEADGTNGVSSKPPREEVRRYATSKESIGNKYAAMREQSRQASNSKPAEKNITSAKVSLLDADNSRSSNITGEPSSRLASTWGTMKSKFQSFKANVEAKKFLPLRQIQESKPMSNHSSSESLDEIFHRLKRPSVGDGNYSDDENENGT